MNTVLQKIQAETNCVQSERNKPEIRQVGHGKDYSTTNKLLNKVVGCWYSTRSTPHRHRHAGRLSGPSFYFPFFAVPWPLRLERAD